MNELQDLKAASKRLGYMDAVLDLQNILIEMDVELSLRIDIQVAIIKKQGEYLRPTNANLYDKL